MAKQFPTPQDLPIIEVDKDADVFLAGKDTVADVKFADMTFYIAVTGADGVRLCHADDHSCYRKWTVYGQRPQGSMKDDDA